MEHGTRAQPHGTRHWDTAPHGTPLWDTAPMEHRHERVIFITHDVRMSPVFHMIRSLVP
jgi:hypothetical protein